jgi:hypothetical protein
MSEMSMLFAVQRTQDNNPPPDAYGREVGK